LHRPRLQRSKRAVYASALPRMAACVSSRRQYSTPRPFPRRGGFLSTSDARCATRAPGGGGDAVAATACHTQRCIRPLRPTISCRSCGACVLRTRPRRAAGLLLLESVGIENFASARGFELPPGRWC
jgi:hypothetical protein